MYRYLPREVGTHVFVLHELYDAISPLVKLGQPRSLPDEARSGTVRHSWRGGSVWSTFRGNGLWYRAGTHYSIRYVDILDATNTNTS
jgi:hypothetical protein